MVTTEYKVLGAPVDLAPKDVFWAGEFPPNLSFSASSNIYTAGSDFREGPYCHGRFDHVFLVERDLGCFKQWPFVLDEAIRLLKRGVTTLLTLRVANASIFQPHALATFLRLRHDIRFTPVEVDQTTDGHITFTLECTRSAAAPRLNSFEFAVITNGERSEPVSSFVTSVNNIVGIGEIDAGIAICGPESATVALPESRIPIRTVLPCEKFRDKAWITSKKNQIVETSTFENLLIVHDRFSVPPEFLSEMYAFGADFDILNPAQLDHADRRMGDWVSTGSRQPIMSIALLDYDDFDPGAYVNGGAIIAKRCALQRVPWSELLFWGQAEDVELSSGFAASGITPRLARKVALRVTDTRPGFREFFTPLPLLADRYAHLAEPTQDATRGVGVARFGKTVSFAESVAGVLAGCGVGFATDQWDVDPSGLLPRSSTSEISFDFASPVNEALSIDIGLRAAAEPVLQVIVNGNRHEAATTRLGDSSWVACAVIPHEAVACAPSGPLMFARSLRIGIDTDMPCVVSEICVDRAEPTITYPVRLGDRVHTRPKFLGSGWGVVEPWGVWSDGRSAELYLAIPPEHRNGELELVFTLSTLVRPNGDDLLVGVACEDVAIASYALGGSSRSHDLAVTIPRQLTARSREVVLRFDIANPVSPQQLGISTDPRLLGIGLERIALGRASKGRKAASAWNGVRSSASNLGVSSLRKKRR